MKHQHKIFQHEHFYENGICIKCESMDMMRMATRLKLYDPFTTLWENSPIGRAFCDACELSHLLGCPVPDDSTVDYHVLRGEEWDEKDQQE
jgi:hypothetical protein